MGIIEATISGLVGYTGKSGVLDTRVPGVNLLLAGREFVQTTFEIEVTPSGGAPYKLIQTKINLREGLIDPDSIHAQPILGNQWTRTDTIPSGVVELAVVFTPALTTPPSWVNPIVHVPEGEGIVMATVRKNSVTNTGFIVDLDGPTDSANYVLKTEIRI
jgi:hypothetical protein